MAVLIVVNNPDNWPLDIPGVELVSARSYLTDASYSQLKGAQLFNLCRSYAYQSLGYYVSLLAEARGHRPQPSITTIQDMKSSTLIRSLADDIDELVQKTLRHVRGEEFTLSIYFGQSLAQRDQHLARQLFNLFPAPLLRAEFKKKEDLWQLRQLAPIAASDIPAKHHPYVIQAAAEHFKSRRAPGVRKRPPRYTLAILHDPDEDFAPSNDKAMEKFVRAAEHADMEVELITRHDFGRLSEFDALFIRTTTQVNDYTYRFARAAAAEGLVVIDDPLSIARCTNKVYLAELMNSHHIPIPRTLIVHRDNADEVGKTLGLPCVLKQPDGAFSKGVKKVSTEQELQQMLEAFLEDSDLVVAQEFMPTEFDWRVGIINHEPLYVSRYYMASQHWQIYNSAGPDGSRYGRVETIPLYQAPPQVVESALKAAKLIGDGLYGVDLKQVGDQVYIIEVNDNPSIDYGYEDQVLKNKLYEKIMQVFVDRIDARREAT